MNSEHEVPINPHIWRKSKNVSGGRNWNGNRATRKSNRRACYWSRHMLKLTNKLFGDED
jgi:hypothetical protein